MILSSLESKVLFLPVDFFLSVRHSFVQVAMIEYPVLSLMFNTEQEVAISNPLQNTLSISISLILLGVQTFFLFGADMMISIKLISVREVFNSGKSQVALEC